jgi:hypothetical protein
MASYGLVDAARAILERVGPNARYSSFIPPSGDYTPPLPRQRPLERLIWTASLILLVLVLLLALLVALGL